MTKDEYLTAVSKRWPGLAQEVADIRARLAERNRVAEQRQAAGWEDTGITEANADIVQLLETVDTARRERDMVASELYSMLKQADVDINLLCVVADSSKRQRDMLAACMELLRQYDDGGVHDRTNP